MQEIYDWQAEIEELDERAAHNLRNGRIMRIASWPIAAGSGVALAALSHEHVLGMTGDLLHSPQSAVMVVPPLALGLGGLLLKSMGEEQQEEARTFI